MGGPGGAIAARVIGGGPIGAAVAGAGTGLNAFLASDDRRVQAARDREARQQSRDDAARATIKARRDLAEGGMDYAQKIGRMAFLGGSRETLKGYTEMGKDYGLLPSQAIDTYLAAQERPGIKPEDIMLGLTTGVLGGNASEVSSAILEYNGLQNAIAAKAGMTQEQAAGALESWKANPMALAIANANIQDMPVEQTKISALLSGETETAKRLKAQETLNPGAGMVAEASRKAMETMAQLQAAAAAQGEVANALATAAKFWGIGEGSERQKLEQFANTITSE
jgi:hypothetical protein